MHRHRKQRSNSDDLDYTVDDMLDYANNLRESYRYATRKIQELKAMLDQLEDENKRLRATTGSDMHQS